MRRAIQLSIFLGVLILGAPSRVRGQTFQLINAPNARETHAQGINNRGRIVGWFIDSASRTHGFLLIDEYFTVIDFPGAANSAAYGINDAGQIVGVFNHANRGYSTDGYTSHGFLRNSDGSFTPLDVPFPDVRGTRAYGINNAGQIVGVFDVFGSPVRGPWGPKRIRGFLLSGGQFSPIDAPGPPTQTHLTGISDHGQIVGGGTDAQGRTNSFVRQPDGSFRPLAVPFPGARDTSAQGISSGVIVGTFTNARGRFTGFIRYAGFDALEDPSPRAIKTYVFGINDAFQIVGSFLDATGTHGFATRTHCGFAPVPLVPVNRSGNPVSAGGKRLSRGFGSSTGSTATSNSDFWPRAMDQCLKKGGPTLFHGIPYYSSPTFKPDSGPMGMLGYDTLDETFHYDPAGLAKQPTFDAIFKLADAFAEYVLYLRFKLPGAPPLLGYGGDRDEIVGALTRCLWDDGLIPQLDLLKYVPEYRNFIDPLHASDKPGAPTAMREAECEREHRFHEGLLESHLSSTITLDP